MGGGFELGPCFYGVVLGDLSGLAIILLRKRELVVLHCVVGVCGLRLFLMVSGVGLLSMIQGISCHTHWSPDF